MEQAKTVPAQALKATMINHIKHSRLCSLFHKISRIQGDKLFGREPYFLYGERLEGEGNAVVGNFWNKTVLELSLKSF